MSVHYIDSQGRHRAAKARRDLLRASRMAALVLLLQGCTLAPDVAYTSALHVSQPMRGAGPAPIGGASRPETTYDAVEAGVRWERGEAFTDASMAYVVNESNLTGGPWVFTLRTGVRFNLRK